MAKASTATRRKTVKPRVLLAAERAIDAKIAEHKDALVGAKPPFRRKLRVAIRELRRINRSFRAAFLGKTCPSYRK